MERTFIIIAFGLYLASAGFYIASRLLDARPGGGPGLLRVLALAVFFAGWCSNVTGMLYRGITAGHLPFSNMYETMITMGVCMFPFLLFSEYVLKSRTGWIEGILGAVILFPSCFIFDSAVRHLPPALRSNLFFPHVTTYLLAYASMAKAMILSVLSLVHRRRGGWADFERVAYRMTAVGFPLLTAGLLLGGVWAQRAWGDYWSWDPKEVWSLITWIIYLVYFHVRVGWGRGKWWCDLLNLLGFAAIVITLLAVNLAGIFGGLHSYA